MPFYFREEGRILYRGGGPRELKGIDPLIRRLALQKNNWSYVSDLLGSTALEEVMIYDEPVAILGPFEAHKPISLEFVGIENEVDEKLEPGKQGHLGRIKTWIEGYIQLRQKEEYTRDFSKLPEGWVPPTVRLMWMVVKKGYEEAGEEAIET
jgi:hypothetical protein